MQRCDRQSCSAIRVNGAARIERLTHELKDLNFGVYSWRVNQSGACSSSDVMTSGGRKSQTTMEDKVIVVVCGYPELYDTTLYFYKNSNTFWKRLELPGRSPSHDANSRLLCSEFHAQMKRVISKCSSVQLRARFIRVIRVWCEYTFSGCFLARIGCNVEKTSSDEDISILCKLRDKQECIRVILWLRYYDDLHHRAGVTVLGAAVADEKRSRRFPTEQLLCLASTEISYKPALLLQQLIFYFTFRPERKPLNEQTADCFQLIESTWVCLLNASSRSPAIVPLSVQTL